MHRDDVEGRGPGGETGDRCVRDREPATAELLDDSAEPNLDPPMFGELGQVR